MSVDEHLSRSLPRVLIVSRRAIRKDKFIDAVGEFHLDLIVKFGACPVIVPRTVGIAEMLDAYEPFHGLVLCEGEDVGPRYLQRSTSEDEYALNEETLAKIRSLHPSDTTLDAEKDSIEFQLVKRCMQRDVPLLGICRGSQVINVSAGGTLFLDVEEQLKGSGCAVQHINYDNYDGHRHPVNILPDTPLREWFAEEPGDSIYVNSYHHQGCKKLGPGLLPMAFAPDGLCEAFYERRYNPGQGLYRIGLQFHPERMVKADGTHDYVGCPRVYESFGVAVQAYFRQASAAATTIPQALQAPPPAMPPLARRRPSSAEGSDANALARAGPVEERRKLVELGFCEAAAQYKRQRSQDTALSKRAMRSNTVQSAAEFFLASRPSQPHLHRSQSANAWQSTTAAEPLSALRQATEASELLIQAEQALPSSLPPKAAAELETQLQRLLEVVKRSARSEDCGQQASRLPAAAVRLCTSF